MIIYIPYYVNYKSVKITCHISVICAECYPRVSEPPPPPVDIQVFSNLVIWRNAPNISCDDITGYEIQFINSATNKKLIEHVEASATFYNLEKLNETFKSDLTYVQVSYKISKYQEIISYMQVRMVSSEHLGNFSQLKSLGMPRPCNIISIICTRSFE